MSHYQSVSAWLKEIRSNAEYYEPLAIFSSTSSSEGGAGHGDDDHRGMGEVAREDLEDSWECDGVKMFPLNFGEERCLSVFFGEAVEELKATPVFYDSAQWDVPEDVMLWREELRFDCEESVSESEEFINSIKIEDDSPPHSYPKPPKFPVPDDPVVVRNKTQLNAPRAKTFNYDLSGFSTGKLNEIKGVSKIVIGEVLCAKINRQERIVFEDNEIHVVDRSGQNKVKVLKDQVELRRGIQQLDKKNVVLHDVNNIPIQLYFDNSKDAKCFVESKGLDSPLGEKSSIKTRLFRLLGKRSSKEVLVEKGIYMNESIFGNTIQDIYQMHNCVPEFLTRSIELIEMPNNINQVGIYRTSGNLATIQKIRFEVDKGNLNILNQYYEDVDVLTGALKLFFRELKEPLIPIKVSEELLSSSEKSAINLIVRKLATSNYETLMCLLRHLLNIVEHKETNKMDIYNMTICWGPSLMFIPDNCIDIMTQSTNNSKVLDLLLNYYKDHPKDLSRSLEQIDTKGISETRVIKELEPLKGHKKSSSCSNINDAAYEIITKMIELVEANAKTEGLYKKVGSQVKIDKISKKIAKGKTNEIEKVKADIHDFAGALRKYINDLAEPIIPKEFFEEYNCDNFNHNLVKLKLKKNVDTIKRKDVLTILLRHMVRVLNEEKSNKTTLNDMCIYWRNVLIKTNQDDKIKTKLLEILLETYGYYKIAAPTELPKPMPDVIKDIEAMARFSKYENVNVTQNLKFAKDSSRGEARVLEEKTDNQGNEIK